MECYVFAQFPQLLNVLNPLLWKRQQQQHALPCLYYCKKCLNSVFVILDSMKTTL